jgi:spermidine/putrescine-binding protein
MITDFLDVPKGSKPKANALKLISWMLDAKRQAAYATDTAVGPANIRALDLLAATLDKVTERWSLDLLHCTTHCLVAEWAVGALLTGS